MRFNRRDHIDLAAVLNSNPAAVRLQKTAPFAVHEARLCLPIPAVHAEPAAFGVTQSPTSADLWLSYSASVTRALQVWPLEQNPAAIQSCLEVC